MSRKKYIAADVSHGREILINFVLSLALTFFVAGVVAYALFVQLPELP